MREYIKKLTPITFMLLLAILILPLDAFASEVGMPQFDVSTFASQVFWLVVTFTILFILMWKVALPRVGETLDKRRQKISFDIEKAEQLKVSAEKINLELEETLAAAKSTAQEVIAKANLAIAKDQEKKLNAFMADLDIKTAEAEKRIELARKAAIAGISEVASEATQAVVEKLSGNIVDDKTIAAALDAAAKEA